MKLDDLRKVVYGEEQMAKVAEEFSLEEMKTDVRDFDRAMKRNFVIESLVAAISFVAVTAMILGGHIWYPYIINELFPGFAKGLVPEMNIAMYAGLVLMALYSIVIPTKRFFAERMDVSLNWTLASRIESEIAKMEKQHKLWSTAHIWSIAPAAVIGISFFWGLNKSLTGTWIPHAYLWLYFGFVVLSAIGGLWLKNNMLTKNIQPMLDRLYGVRKEIHGELK